MSAKQIKDTPAGYGWVSIALHWLVAVAVVGLFALGLWMTDLTYYDPWYNQAPDIHRSVGVLLLLVLIARLGWRGVNPKPRALDTHKAWERRLAHYTHALLYGLMVVIMISGYLITTAEGDPVRVFDWFTVPATLSGIEHQEDIAGEIHEILAFVLIGLAILHALAAFKHHFLDRDRTLRRMLHPMSPSGS